MSGNVIFYNYAVVSLIIILMCIFINIAKWWKGDPVVTCMPWQQEPTDSRYTEMALELV